MTFAPVGIRCPDHANIGAVKPSPARTLQTCAASDALGRGAGDDGADRDQRDRLRDHRRAGRPASTLPGGKLFLDWALHGYGGRRRRLVAARGTAMFLHGSILHLAFNMLALYWLGTIVEQALGHAAIPPRLLRLRPRRIGGSALVQLAFAVTVGASGAIFGLIGALLILEYLATGSLIGQAMVLILVNLASSRSPSRDLDRRATSAASPAGSSRPTR